MVSGLCSFFTLMKNPRRIERTVEIHYGIAETIGRRGSMEDTHAVGYHGRGDIFSAEVYDGHSGSAAAKVAAEMLTRLFLGEESHGEERTPHTLTPEALRTAYVATDELIVSGETGSGTAAATLYITPTGFLAANAGDCRIVVGEGTGSVVLTQDHKPDVPEERARIEDHGGTVVTLDVARVQGSLAMSRALGDASLKPFVTAEPRVVEGTFGRKNEVAIIACDGLWDVVLPEEAVAITRNSRVAQEAADRLCALAISKGSGDNITIVVLDLRSYVVHAGQKQLQITRVLDRAVEGLSVPVT